MNIYRKRFLVTRALIASAILYGCSVSAQPLQPVYFDQYLEKKNSLNGVEAFALEKFCPVSTSIIARRVLESYGSMFVANSVNLPATCIHKGEGQVLDFQKKAGRAQLDIRGVRIELQAAAAKALQQSVDEATAAGLVISPFDGSIAGARSYGDTLMLWNSRVFPALSFWTRRGKLTTADVEELNKLDLEKKIEKILLWESRGIYFSSDRSRSILTSTAPPGTSQHLALIAFDVVECWNPQVRSILNRNGWYQTVIEDPGHFTYLGAPEAELPSRGLTAVAKGGYLYWVPNLPPATSAMQPMN